VSPRATSAAATGTQARGLQDEFVARPVPLGQLAAEHGLDMARAWNLRAQRPRAEALSTMPLLTLACAATGWTRHRTSLECGLTLAAVHRNLWRAATALGAGGIPAAVHHAYTTCALPRPQAATTPRPPSPTASTSCCCTSRSAPSPAPHTTARCTPCAPRSTSAPTPTPSPAPGPIASCPDHPHHVNPPNRSIC
jgi:hypothetical protein